MKQWFSLFALIALSLSSQFVWSESAFNHGYDLVSYFKPGGPLKGDAKFQVRLQEVTYFFASEANKKEFLESPQKYQPQFGGWCAYAIADSKTKVDVDPTSYLIQDGRLLLFYNGLWADTRKTWLKNQKLMLRTADANWPEVMKDGAREK